MKKAKRINRPIKFFLTPTENTRYELLLAPFAGKKGPYAKKLLLDHLNSNFERLCPTLPENDQHGSACPNS